MKTLKIRLSLEVMRNDEHDYEDGPTFTTTEETLVKDIKEKALTFWTRNEIAGGHLTYDDLTNRRFSCPIHREVFPEDYEEMYHF